MSPAPDALDHYLPPLTPRGRRWARFLGVALSIALLLWFAYALRAVLTPLLAALALAYVLNPVVSFTERMGLRRLFIIVVIYLLGSGLLLTGGAVLAVKAFGQFIDLKDNIGAYAEAAADWIRKNPNLQFSFLEDASPASQPIAQAPDSAPSVPIWSRVARPAGQRSGLGDWLPKVVPLVKQYGLSLLNSLVQSIWSFFSNLYAVGSILVLIPMYTFFFLLEWNHMTAAIRDYLPAAYRETVLHFARTIDRAVADFFRGRLVVCLVIALVTAIGWQVVGVRYGILWGLLAGLLNLVPFMSMLALPPALFFAFANAVQAQQPWAGAVVMAFAVYLLAQALESFVLSPTIEAQAAGLHPIATVVALLIGAQVAGFLGLLLAIPLASTLRTLGAEFVLPEIRRLAKPPDASAAPLPAPIPAGPPNSASPKPQAQEPPNAKPPADAGSRSQ